MHIEKNVFDNIMNTVLNVPGKTKDNMKTRLELPRVCNRKVLEITEDGKTPIPTFRLSNEARKVFFRWLKREIKFPDGYVADISAYVDEENWRLADLRSHDCHVIMQCLLPIAFLELLPRDVHIAISDIALFFRDICGRTLKTSDVEVMKANIALKICNLEKNFPPSFFDVMEHLPVHLPNEAALGGPVQFRWMYPFERYMHHLKMKAKNKAKIGGSIVAQCITEKISHFCSYYFAADGQGSHHHHTTDGEIQFTYNYPGVRTMFQPNGRVSGKSWLTEEDAHILHTFLLLNCEEIEPYERLFEEYMCIHQPGITDSELILAKEKHFALWCRDHVSFIYTL